MALNLNDILEFRANYSITGENAINVFHAQVSNLAGTGQSEVQVATAQFARLSAAISGLMSTAATLVSISCQKILPAPAAAAGFSTSASVAGTVAGDLLPPQVSGMITKRSGLAGRANRGRWYMPYPGEADNTSAGFPVVGYTNRLATLAALLILPWTAGGGGNTVEVTPQILHRALGTVILWNAWTARDYWTTQRRRTNGA